jgi:hypothetical protein
MKTYSSPSHSFEVSLAREYSVEEALMIHHFQHWIKINVKLKKNFKDGKTWTYQTLEYIAAHFDYWSRRQVERLINKLVKNKVLRKGNFNSTPYDRTVWYCFEDEERFLSFIDKSPNGDLENSKWGNENHQSVTPIPDTKTYTKEREREGASPRASPSPPFRLSENQFEFKSKISGMTRIKMPIDRHKKLVEDFGCERVDEMLERLDEYADINAKKFKQYSCHDAVLRKWLREEKVRMPLNRAATDLEVIKKLERYKDLTQRGEMILGHDYVQFPGVHGENTYKAGEPGFLEKISLRFRKMNIPLEI